MAKWCNCSMVILATTVHTSGINWASVLTITGSVITVVTIVFGFIARLVSNQITSAINKFRIEVVTKLDIRLTHVEQKLDDIQTNTRRR